MKQFLLCVAMLLCSIFMYIVVTMLETSTYQKTAQLNRSQSLIGDLSVSDK